MGKNKSRARGCVISDNGVMQMARQRPETHEEIREIEDIHPGALTRYQDELLSLIADSQSAQTPVEKIEPLRKTQTMQIKAMRRVVSHKAQELAVDPALLASRKELEKLIRAAANGE